MEKYEDRNVFVLFFFDRTPRGITEKLAKNAYDEIIFFEEMTQEESLEDTITYIGKMEKKMK